MKVIVTIALALRGLITVCSPILCEYVETHPQIVTPLTGFGPVKEATHLLSSRYGSVSSGQIFHQPPLVLSMVPVFRSLDERNVIVRLCMQAVLFLLEIITAYLLSEVYVRFERSSEDWRLERIERYERKVKIKDCNGSGKERITESNRSNRVYSVCFDSVESFLDIGQLR